MAMWYLGEEQWGQREQYMQRPWGRNQDWKESHSSSGSDREKLTLEGQTEAR